MAGFKEYQMLFQLNASMGGGFQSTFASGTNSVTQLQEKINALNKTQSDIASYQKQQSAIEKTKSKIDLYQTQLQNLQNATANTSKEEAELANAIAAKEKQLTDATAKLDQQNAALSETGQALREAGVNTSDLAGESERLKAEAAGVAQAQKEEAEAAQEAGKSLKDAMEGAKAALEAAGIVSALKEIYGGLMDCSSAAAQFETSMAGVKRTVGGSDGFIKDLGENFKEMSTQMPITANELAGIATTAGQLGIAQSNVEGFTTVMAKLATTTDLTADTAATMLAQFSNITGVTDYDRLGSAVASLGDATATTASKVVEMSQGMAASASIAGMSSTDILAIAAAVGSLGIEAASGSTSMSTLISTLYKATETGEKLDDFASVAGMSAEEFRTAWGENAVGALDAFIQGLNDTERNGRSAVVILDELGINNVRQTKAILGLASAGDLLSNTVAQANTAWTENTALTEKAAVMYNTTEAKMTMMQNAANNVKIAIGDALNPAMSTAYETATNLLQPIAEWIEKNPALVQGVTAFIGVLGLATAGVVSYTAYTKLAAAASAIFAGSIPGIGIILGVAGAVGLLTAGLSALAGASNEASVSFEDLDSEYDNLQKQFNDNKKTLELVDTYKELNEQTSNLQKLLDNDFSTEVRFTGKVGDADKLKPSDFVDSTTVKLTAEQAKLLAANSFLDGAVVTLTPKQAEFLKAQGFLEDETVFLDPKEKEKMDAGEFVDGATVYLTGEMAGALAAEDYFPDGTTVQLTAEKAEALHASDFMADQVVEITAENGNTLTAADFGLSDQTVKYLATMDNASYESVKSQAESLKSQITQVDSQLTTARNALQKSIEQAGILEEKINGTKNRKQKTALQERLDSLNESIATQQGNIDQLEERHAALSAEYGVVGTAAEELQGKEEALTAAKQALADASDRVASASGKTAEAFDVEAEAAARDAEAQLAVIRSKMYENIREQTKSYAKATSEAAEAEDKYTDAVFRNQTAQKYSGNGIEDLNANYQTLLKTLDDMEDAEGFDPTSTDYQTAVREVEALANLMDDANMDLQQYAGQNIDWVKSFGDIEAYEGSWSTFMQELSEGIVEYSSQVQTAEKTQNDFIDNLVAGVESGAMTIEELEARVREAAGNEADAEATVAAIMDEVRAGVEAAKESKEEYAETSEEVAEGAGPEVQAVESIIENLKTLKKAYEDAYNSAYSSMSGQFGLFESAKDSINKMTKGASGGMKGMQKSLEEQATYIEQYSNNYAVASANMESAGVSQETANAMLNSLADGSVESAQYLQTLAAASNDELTALATAYETLQKQKETYAETVAEIQTDFSDSMTELQNQLTETVESMDMSSEAAANAKATLDAYINAADGYGALASLKFGAVAAAAVAALKAKLGKLFGGGYARGTEDAKRGLAWVGENGPELMWFNGGEQVMNHNDSVAYAQSHLNSESAEPAESISGHGFQREGNLYTVDFSPVYNISGSNAEEVRSVLEEHDANMREQIESIINEISEDEERRSFA